MRNLKKRKISVILFIIFLILGICIWYGQSRFSHEVNIDKTNPMISVGEDGWDYGRWEMSSVLSTTAENYTVSEDGLELVGTLSSDLLEDNEVTLSTWGQLEDGSLLTNIEKNEFVVNLPLYLFYTYSIDYLMSYDEEKNALIFSNNETDILGYVKMPDGIDYCDYNSMDCSTLENDYLWMYDEFQVYIYNNKEITTDVENYNFNFDVTYSFTSKEIGLGTINIVYPYIVFENDNYVDFPPLSLTLNSNEETNISLDNVGAETEKIFDEWQSEWGIQSTEHDFYIEYGVQGFILANENFSLNFELNHEDGEILAYTCNSDEYFNDIENSNCNNNYNSSIMLKYNVVVGYDFEDASTNKSGDMGIKIILITNEEPLEKNLEWHFNYDKNENVDINYPVGTSLEFNQTLTSDNAGIGAINQLRNNDTVSFNWLLESGTDSLNDSTSGIVKAFNLWNLTENGSVDYTVELGTNGGVLDTSYSTEINPYILNDNYEIVSFYPQDDIEYNYLLSGNTYVLDKVLDVANYTDKMVYVKIDDKYELIGSYKKNENGNIVYFANDDRTMSNDNVSVSNPIVLPEGTKDIKVSYTGKRAAVYLGFNFETKLSSNQDIISYIDDLNNQDLVLKNRSFVKCNDSVTNESTGTYLTELESNTYSDIVSVVNDKENDSNSISITSYVYEQINYNDNSLEIAKEVINEQSAATFYLLLPVGATLDGNIQISKYGNNEIVEYTLEKIDNYKDSNRSLLIVNIKQVDDNYYITDNYVQSGFAINYNLLYSDANNLIYGNVLNNDIAYVSNTNLSDGYTNPLDVSDSLFSSIEVKNIFNELLGTDPSKNKMFITDKVTLDEISVIEGTYEKLVKNELENEYSTKTNVVESNKYIYRLQYVLGSNYEEIKNVILVDKLENSYVDNNYFKGILENIDITYLKEMGVNPVVYYSTNNNVNLEQIDLSNVDWSTNKPSDMSKVAAIAVDCGDYIFKGSENKTLFVDIVMKATNSYRDDIKAYNESFMYYSSINSGSNKVLKTNMTETTLNKATVSLEATANIGNGTELNPAIIQDKLSYELKLSNNSDLYDYDDLEIEVKLPQGLKFVPGDDQENIDYSYDEVNNTLIYKILNLKELEKMNILVNLEVDLDNIDFSKVMISSIKLSKLGNNQYNGDEISLYNQLKVPVLEFGKYAKTEDTGDFSDLASLIIKSGETYQYRIKIDNISAVGANSIVVKDNVPEGLIVDENTITNNGVYDSSNHLVTWNVDTLNAYDSISLEYSVKVPTDISLGTLYRSSAHISLINPFDKSLMLYDDDTNIISTLYQVVSDIKLENKLEGLLADYNKKFKYEIEFNGDASSTGRYDVVDKNNEVVGALEIDSEGKGVYNALLSADESLIIRLLPSGINYSIKQELVEGYEVETNVTSTKDDASIIIEGITNEERLVNYIFTNKYDVKTSLNIGANVTYDKDISLQDFKLSLKDSNGVLEEKEIDDTGKVEFSTINYDNVDGQYIYYVSQVDLGDRKIAYDTMIYKIVVNLVNDGKGTLNKEVNYYNKLDERVTDIVFNNVYIPNGLVIGNINSSDYVDNNKLFNYEVIISNVTGSYDVVDMENNKITTLVADDNEMINYSVNLKSDERIKIVDLPQGLDYRIVQNIEDYYTVKVDNLNYQIDNDKKQIIVSGITEDDTTQIIFNNNYVTVGEFQPKVKVVLEDKLLEDKEFQFMIKDVSNGSSNGYIEYAENNLDGEVIFKNISYNKPGKYIYEITQVKGNSNHIYYDLGKCLLTIELIDNGNGTMKVLSNTYEFTGNNDYFVNRYSVDPIIKDEVDDVTNVNPETHDRIFIIGILLGIVLILFVIEGRIKRRKYELKI